MLHEVFDVCNWLAQLSDSELQPFLGLIISSLDLNGDEFVDFLDFVLWSWLDLGSRTVGVKQNKTNGGSGWNLGSEHFLVRLKQLDCILETFNWIGQPLVDEDLQVDLLVSPVDFKDLLELLEEAVHPAEGAVKDG